MEGTLFLEKSGQEEPKVIKKENLDEANIIEEEKPYCFIQNDEQTSNASNVHSLSDNAFGDSAPEDDAIDDSVDAWNDYFSSNSSFSDSEASVSFSRIKALQRKTPRRPSFAVFHPERRFECEFCNKKFLKLSHLKGHEGTHDSKNPYECTQCEQTCPTKDDLDIHFKIHEMGAVGIDSSNQPPSFHCQICNKKYSTRKTFNYHVKSIHKPKNLHRCFVCRKEFTDEKNLSNHLKVHKIKYDCESCGKVFKRGATLKRHMKIHGEKEFECTYCNIKFHQKCNLTQHLKLHQSSDHDGFKKTIPCKICHKRFETTHRLKLHMIIHTREKVFKCSECNEEFLWKQVLEGHWMHNHKNEKPMNLSVIKQLDEYFSKPENRNKCEYCYQECETPYALALHRRSHVVVTPKESSKCKQSSGKLTKLLADSKIQGNRSLVSQENKFQQDDPTNMQATLGHQLKQPLRCNICKTVILTTNDLDKHMEMHNGIIRPFKCWKCPKKFLYERNLNAHIQNHERHKLQATTSESTLTNLLQNDSNNEIQILFNEIKSEKVETNPTSLTANFTLEYEKCKIENVASPSDMYNNRVEEESICKEEVILPD